MIEPTPPLPETWSPPKSFDEYRLLRPLGKGGMGEVHLAHDMVLDRPVAVKFISALDAPGSREQFLIEARAAARLQHPNVLTIYRVGELDDRPFIISEFIRGRSLDTVVKPMPWKRALELGIGLSRGLAAAHRKGVLHRDIKPGNAVIGDDGVVKLLDFGLAKLMDIAALQAELGITDLAPISRDAPTIEMPPPALDEERALHGLSSIPPEPKEARDATESVEPPPPDWRAPNMLQAPKDAPTADAVVVQLYAANGAATTDAAVGPLRAANSAATTDAAVGPLHAVDGTATTDAAVGPPPLKAPVSGIDSPPPSSRSDASMIRGTPHYMAPELWRSETATRRSDVYALGAVLYELCTGAPPHMNVPLYELPRTAVRRDAPPLKQVAPSVDPRFAAVVDKCLRRDPAERFASGDELREALEQIIHQARRDSIPEGNPYRGLLPFETEHRSLFFGRSTEIGTILERLRSEAVVVIVGESGVGKSSLCKAGVLPLIADGALGGTRQWTTVTLVPGRTPVDVIASTFAGMLRTSKDKLADKLRTKPASLARNLYRQLGDSNGAVVFIDQLEELVTLSEPADVRVVGEIIASLATHVPGVRLLMTARSDLLARIASIASLGDELARGLYFLRPLSTDKIREAIVGPARAKGVSFESEELIQTLVDSTARAEGGLPLLQFALAELWEARANPRAPITAQALKAIGGVTGALTRHADNVLASMPREQHAAARTILTAMVTVEETLARRSEEELLATGDRAREALDALVRGRLLVAREAGGAAAYEVAHEALIKNWAVLRAWLDEELEGRVVRQRLEAAAAEWERLGRTREELWSARQLAEATDIDLGELGAREAAFLEASRGAVRRQKILRTVAIAAAPIVFGLIYGAAKISTEREQARRVRTFVADSQTLKRQAGEKDAEVEDLRRRAFDAFKAGNRKAGEPLYEGAVELSTDVEKLRGRASQALEAALTIAGHREDVRGQLGDILFERALAAEREQRHLQRDDHLQRMALYDTDEARRRAWDAPAHVAIETSPPGARVTVAQYVSSEPHRLSLTEGRVVGVTPVADVSLAQGSYLVTLAADGLPEVRYPVQLARDERLRIAVDLLPASAIPRGFIYIPAGRYTYGSTAEKHVRQFLETMPAHRATTGAFLIAQNETTFGDWIAFLRALPPEERARRAVKIGTPGTTGAVELAETADGSWRLTFTPTSQEYSAREGERITYRGRKNHADQDWLRIPVSGVTSEDAMAYAAWLHKTGRVEGARLCSEHEWERAARGADDREFPSSRKQLDPEDANFDETYGQASVGMGPDEVGSRPASRSPFGLDDMAGNVCEWVISPLSENGFSLRGGSFFFNQMSARSTNRTVWDASLRDARIGLRVCASIPQQR